MGSDEFHLGTLGVTFAVPMPDLVPEPVISSGAVMYVRLVAAGQPCRYRAACRVHRQSGLRHRLSGQPWPSL